MKLSGECDCDSVSDVLCDVGDAEKERIGAIERWVCLSVSLFVRLSLHITQKLLLRLT